MTHLPRLPSTMQVFERGWLSANNVLFSGREECALVDSGYVTHAAQTVALLARALDGRPLDWLLNTHLHSDHCGGNAMLQGRYGCRTTIPEAEADKVRAWDEDALSYRATGQQCPRFGFDDTMRPGQLLTLGELGWQVLGAPGHDPHSMILYCPEERILISADALWQSGFGIVFPELDGASGFAELRATLDLIAGLDVRLVIPGHGPMFTGFEAALEAAYGRLDFLTAEPARNARHALKSLLSFLLLAHQHLPLARVQQLLADVPMFRTINANFFRQPEAALAQWAVAQLVRAGVAVVEDGVLINRG